MPGPWTYSNEHIPTTAEVVFEIYPVKYIESENNKYIFQKLI